MTMKRLSRMVAAIAAAVLGCAAEPGSIRQVDLRNFSYPFIESADVPSVVQWMPAHAKQVVTLKQSEHRFESRQCRGTALCPLLTLDSIQYGRLTGTAEDAAVVMTYHTGGSASWQYVYVVALRSGTPTIVAWLETGSRGEGGLRKIAIDGGVLSVEVNDPAEARAACCSSGFIRTSYGWRDGSFRQIGDPVRGEIPDDK